MKDLTLSVVGVVVISLGFGLAFHWLYPRVELTGELFGLFVFVALVLKLGISKLWSFRGKTRAATAKKASK